MGANASILQDYGGRYEPLTFDNSYAQLAEQQRQFNEQNQTAKDKQKAEADKAEAERKKALTDKYKLKPEDYKLKNFDADKELDKRVADANLEIAKEIEGKNMTDPQVMAMAQEKAKNLKGYYYGAGALLSKNEQMAKELATDPLFDAEAFRIAADNEVLFTKDEKGNKVQKVDGFDPNDDVQVRLLRDHPELFQKGTIDIAGKAGKMPVYEKAGTVVETKNGRTLSYQGLVKFAPFQEPAINSKGEITGVITKADIGNLNGNEIPIADDNTWAGYNSTPGEINANNASVKKFAQTYTDAEGKKPYADIKPGTEEYNTLGKHWLYLQIKDIPPKIEKQVDKNVAPIYKNTTNVNNGNSKKDDDYSWVPGRIEQLKKDATENTQSAANITGPQLATLSKGGKVPDGVQYNPIDKKWYVKFYKDDKETIDYGLTYIATDEDIANALTLGASTGKLRDTELDKNDKRRDKQPEKPVYTNITETKKGTIGVKNGKWYDIKTGKPIQ